MAASRSIDISVESVEETSIQTLRATLGVLRELREGREPSSASSCGHQAPQRTHEYVEQGAGGYAAEQTLDQQSAIRSAQLKLLHTPLMAATNAVSGISLVASHVLAGSHQGWVATALGTIAVACATANVVGGFLSTDRILAMFRRTREGKSEVKEGATSAQRT